MKHGFNEVYTVWGGDPENEADHWATFRFREYAQAYRDEQLRLNPRLILGISREKSAEGEVYADAEWEARFSPYCTSGCRLGGGLCALCESFFLEEKQP